jgi:hypothetical protein
VTDQLRVAVRKHGFEVVAMSSAVSSRSSVFHGIAGVAVTAFS